MVYHLRNWEILRDFGRTNPDLVTDVIQDILKNDLQVPVHNPIEIRNIVEACSKAETREGFEGCLNFRREDISIAFREPRQSSMFEMFLEKLDKEAEILKKENAENHVL